MGQEITMDQKIITADDVLTLLDAAVEDRGEKYRYPKKPLSWKVPYYGPAITDDQVLPSGALDGLDELQEVDAEESGSCHYFATERDAGLSKGIEAGAPMCIVGWVLNALGYRQDDMDRFTNIGASAEKAVDRVTASRPGLGRFAAEAVDVLANAQSEQDGGTTWGGARDVARRDHLSRTDGL